MNTVLHQVALLGAVCGKPEIVQLAQQLIAHGTPELYARSGRHALSDLEDEAIRSLAGLLQNLIDDHARAISLGEATVDDPDRHGWARVRLRHALADAYTEKVRSWLRPRLPPSSSKSQGGGA